MIVNIPPRAISLCLCVALFCSDFSNEPSIKNERSHKDVQKGSAEQKCKAFTWRWCECCFPEKHCNKFLNLTLDILWSYALCHRASLYDPLCEMLECGFGQFPLSQVLVHLSFSSFWGMPNVFVFQVVLSVQLLSAMPSVLQSRFRSFQAETAIKFSRSRYGAISHDMLWADETNESDPFQYVWNCWLWIEFLHVS